MHPPDNGSSLDAGGPSLVELITGLSAMEFVPPSAHDLGAVLGEILDRALRSSSARAAILHLRERDATRPVASRGEGLDQVPCAHEATATRCELPSYVALNRQPIRIPDVAVYLQGDEHPLVLCAELADLATRMSLLAEPISDHRGEVLGVIELADARDAEGRPCAFPAHVDHVVQALAAQAGSSITNVRLTQKLREAQFETVFRLSVAAEFRDTETASHIQRVSRYSAIIAEGLGLDADQTELARFASPMHDVGKLGVPDAILLKPGKLDDEEWHIMRSHTTMGAQILGGSDSRILQASEGVALSHHEKVDGTGYPLGLRGDDIPLFGRIVSLADAFDAITSRRCYKEAEPIGVGLEIAEKDAGAHFDPACVAALADSFTQVEQVHHQFAEPPAGNGKLLAL